ncbi:MAG TPA: hypothetical protein VHL57_10170 [Flavobacteriales bacterium]|nr:hypothetical protein [Flavobacteriales bacterium]
MDTPGIIGALIALLIIGVGVAIGLIASLALAVLTSVGVVSISILVACWKRQMLAGLQVFFVQCGVLMGAPAGAMLAWGAWHLWPMINGEWRVLAAGAVGGAGGGLVIAWLASAAAEGLARHTWPWVRGRVTIFQPSEA